MVHLTATPLLYLSVRRVREDHGQVSAQADSLHSLASTDALTGLRNRRALADDFADLATGGGSCAVILFDLDHFKRLNDTHGHEAGDAVLIDVARVAQAALRPGDLIGRWGGEDFVVFQPGSGPSSPVEVAERVRSRIAAGVASPSGSVTASFGVARARLDLPLTVSIEVADQVMYQAKAAGRDTVRVAG